MSPEANESSGGTTRVVEFASLTLSHPRIMGVVNVTPDSFSDGGETLGEVSAVARGLELAADGADIIDVGGESTRPGADPVPITEELERVLPVVRELAAAGVLVSIDTRHAEVMKAAIDAGARIVNDVTALTGDGRSLDVIATSDASVVLMHMQGDPRTMQRSPHYSNVVGEVEKWLLDRVSVCQAAGIDRARIAVDPGIGFGKTVDHNLKILANLGVFRDSGCALLIGASRKSFIARVSADRPPSERIGGSLAAVLYGATQGAHIFRVHDVAASRQALDVWRAIEDRRDEG